MDNQLKEALNSAQLALQALNLARQSNDHQVAYNVRKATAEIQNIERILKQVVDTGR